MNGVRLIDGLALLVLFCVGFWIRLPLVPLVDFSSDASDPIISALRMLESLNLFQGDSARFGYGRSLSYVPLVFGIEDGLGGVVVRRIAAQALIAPVTYLSVRMLLSAPSTSRLSATDDVVGVLCSFASALLLVVNQDLLQNLLWGHHGYLGPEWAALLLLGFCGLLVGRALRLWSALSGFAFAMCVMNHPYAIALAPILWVAWSGARQDVDLARARHALLAAGITLLVLLPHLIYVFVAPGGREDLFESLVSSSMLGFNHSTKALEGLFSNIAAPEAMLFAASLFWVLFVPVLGKSLPQSPSLARLIARVSLAVAISFAALVVLGLASRQVHNWHWRMLLPFVSLCFALTLAWLIEQLKVLDKDRRSRRRVVFLGTALTVSLLTVVISDGYHSFRDPAQQPVESLLQLGQIERLYGVLELDPGEAPWTILAIGSPPEQSYARSLPLALQRVLSPRSSLSLAGSADDWLQGPTLYYFEGPQLWIEGLSRSLGELAGSPLWRGARSLAWRLDSREQALQAAESICTLSAGMKLRADSPRDQFALLEVVGLATQGLLEASNKPVSCLRLAP